MPSSARLLSTALALMLVLSTTASAANIVISNVDGAGEGFNDPTPTDPLPDNPGTTLGAQRLIVFERAAAIMGQELISPVEIVVEAQFDAMDCNTTSGILGGAGMVWAGHDFPTAPRAETWYPGALVNALVGSDEGGEWPDIVAYFNSVVDSDPDCLGGFGWYYGLDHEEGNQYDLLAVVTHEISHGLGFASLVQDGSTYYWCCTGDYHPDAYSRLIFDTSTGLHWDEMTPTQRKASAKNDPYLVWSGANVAWAAADVLARVRPPILTVNTPAEIAGDYEAQSASFGPPLTDPGISAAVVLVNDGSAKPTEGCGTLVNASELSGKIALVDRGTCYFTEKVVNAQNAGAIGVLIANNDAAGLPPMGGDDPAVVIPSLGVSLATGDTLKAYLGTAVNATLRLDPDETVAGTNSGLTRLYGPNPHQPGSSISHWTTDAEPNLLMEPYLNSDDTDDLDLTLQLFMDIGWPTVLIFESGFERGDTTAWSAAVVEAP